MKTKIALHEDEHWKYLPDGSGKIDHISVKTAGECFFFDLLTGSVASVVSQLATFEDPRAGKLMISIKFEEDDLNWFLDKPSRIKGLKYWLKNISKDDAKKYVFESLSLPREEIENNVNKCDVKAEEFNVSVTKIALQFMTSAIQYKNPEISVIAQNQTDDLIIRVLESLPKKFRKIKISMPWSSGLELGKINITDESSLPMTSGSMYLVTEQSYAKWSSIFTDQCAFAEKFYNHSLADENLEPGNIEEAIRLENKGRHYDAVNVFKSEKLRNIWNDLHPYKQVENKNVVKPFGLEKRRKFVNAAMFVVDSVLPVFNVILPVLVYVLFCFMHNLDSKFCYAIEILGPLTTMLSCLLIYYFYNDKGSNGKNNLDEKHQQDKNE